MSVIKKEDTASDSIMNEHDSITNEHTNEHMIMMINKQKTEVQNLKKYIYEMFGCELYLTAEKRSIFELHYLKLLQTKSSQWLWNIVVEFFRGLYNKTIKIDETVHLNVFRLIKRVLDSRKKNPKMSFCEQIYETKMRACYYGAQSVLSVPEKNRCLIDGKRVDQMNIYILNLKMTTGSFEGSIECSTPATNKTWACMGCETIGCVAFRFQNMYHTIIHNGIIVSDSTTVAELCSRGESQFHNQGAIVTEPDTIYLQLPQDISLSPIIKEPVTITSQFQFENPTTTATPLTYSSVQMENSSDGTNINNNPLLGFFDNSEILNRLTDAEQKIKCTFASIRKMFDINHLEQKEIAHLLKLLGSKDMNSANCRIHELLCTEQKHNQMVEKLQKIM